MLFIDTFVPQSIDQSYFHKDILNMLKQMTQDRAIPNIIFYGPNGSGKKTLIRLVLEMIYSKDINNIQNVTYDISGSSNKTNSISIKKSNHHIVIEPNNNNFDRYLIQNIVKKYAKSNQINFYDKTKSTFKTVLIDNIDNMSYLAQTSLRRTLEKYSKLCRLI